MTGNQFFSDVDMDMDLSQIYLNLKNKFNFKIFNLLTM